MATLSEIATWLSGEIAALGPFELLSDGSAIPVFAFQTKDDARFTVFELSDRLRQSGWQVPAYTMPEGAEDVAVLRIVVREGFSRDMADELMRAIRDAVAQLEKRGASGGGSDHGSFAH
jgi:glutamate decarboxylase